METKNFREHNVDNLRTLFLPRSYRELREEYRKASNHRYLQRENRYFSGKLKYRVFSIDRYWPSLMVLLNTWCTLFSALDDLPVRVKVVQFPKTVRWSIHRWGHLQLTPDNSNLQGKSRKVRVIGEWDSCWHHLSHVFSQEQLRRFVSAKHQETKETDTEDK